MGLYSTLPPVYLLFVMKFFIRDIKYAGGGQNGNAASNVYAVVKLSYFEAYCFQVCFVEC